MIGADGANSLVRRRVAQPFRRDQLSIATGFFAHGVTSTEIVIEFVADPPGYIWSFPRPGHLAIGICAEADCGTRRGGSPRADRRMDSRDRHRRRRAARAVRVADSVAGGARRPRVDGSPDRAGCSPATPRGLVDPITREGIYFALASGQWAAESLLRDGFAAAYSSRVAEEAGRELGRAARFKAGFFRPAFIGVLMRALQQSAACAR